MCEGIVRLIDRGSVDGMACFDPGTSFGIGGKKKSVKLVEQHKRGMWRECELVLLLTVVVGRNVARWQTFLSVYGVSL